MLLNLALIFDYDTLPVGIIINGASRPRIRYGALFEHADGRIDVKAYERHRSGLSVVAPCAIFLLFFYSILEIITSYYLVTFNNLWKSRRACAQWRMLYKLQYHQIHKSFNLVSNVR